MINWILKKYDELKRRKKLLSEFARMRRDTEKYYSYRSLDCLLKRAGDVIGDIRSETTPIAKRLRRVGRIRSILRKEKRDVYLAFWQQVFDRNGCVYTMCEDCPERYGYFCPNGLGSVYKMAKQAKIIMGSEDMKNSISAAVLGGD